MKQITTDQVVIVRLGRADWRVSSPEGDLLGYVERQHADRYEVVWMTDPLRWGYTDSFEEAVAAFDDGSWFAGETSPKRIADVNPVIPIFTGGAQRRGTWLRKARPRVA